MTGSRLNRDGLVAAFHGYSTPRETFRVGVELERHLLRPDTGLPVPYFGDHGVRWLLERMAPNGWEPYFEGENPIALYKGLTSVTLEPGSQFELSTSPFATMAEVSAEAAAFVGETAAAIGDAPIVPVACGFTPFARIDDVPWVPKGRYAVMKEHLRQTGKLAHHMMKGTCATQASYDFSSEEDAARKVALGIRLGPLTTATFANSPLSEGRPNGYMSFRGKIWTDTDPRRTGFPEAAESFTFERWVDYLLDVPMMFFHDKDGAWMPANGMSFRTWMEQGHDGHFPDEDAWSLHLTSVFPEVRVKRLIEVRGADCVQHPLAMAFAAQFEGLFYDDESLSEALETAARFASHGTAAQRFDVACRQGLEGTVGGRRLAAWAQEIAEIAASGLRRLGKDLDVLEPLVKQIESGESPARGLLRAWEKDSRPKAIVEYLRYKV